MGVRQKPGPDVRNQGVADARWHIGWHKRGLHPPKIAWPPGLA